MIDINSKIYVAGHRGLVGSSIVRNLKKKGFNNLLLKTHDELDLCNQKSVNDFFKLERPDYVVLAAARVGGIIANIESPADFCWENNMIQCNVIKACHDYNVKKLLFLASSCIYPRLCPQPMKEEYLLEGKVEPTNEGYALAKINGVKMCEYFKTQYGDNFISIMPCNLYGPNDNFNPLKSHVVPGMIRRFHEAKITGAKEVTVWGTGEARRELLFVDDLAEASIFMLQEYNGKQFLNCGTNEDYSIRELAEMIKQIIGFNGNIVFDKSKPDGMPQKLMDSTKLNSIGWKPNNTIYEGLEKTYKWYIDNIYNKGEYDE